MFANVFQVADLAIADLTITSDRAAAVDFTSPFMTLGKLCCFTLAGSSLRNASFHVLLGLHF